MTANGFKRNSTDTEWPQRSIPPQYSQVSDFFVLRAPIAQEFIGINAVDDNEVLNAIFFTL